MTRIATLFSLFHIALYRVASCVLLLGAALVSACAFAVLIGPEFALFGGGIVLVMAAIIKTL